MPDFFVLGNPRSGTTLFRIMLNSHPEISVPPECGFSLWLAERYSKIFLQDKQYLSFSRDVQNSRKFETWGVGEKELVDRLVSARPESYDCMVKEVYRVYAQKSGKQSSLFGDKNNFYINMLEALKFFFPASKRLYIIRDLRDVASSYLDVAEKVIDSPYRPLLSTKMEEIAEEWDKNAGKIIEESEVEGGSVYYIRYEDLLSKPEETLISVCRFLDVPYSEKMLNYQNGNDEPADFLQWKGKTKKELDEKNIGRYKDRLTECEVKRLEDISEVNLSYFRYL